MLAILFLSSISDEAQNLVPNPSFEDFEDCDNGGVLTAMEFVVDWFNPNAWSSDYFKDYELPCAINVNGSSNEGWFAPQPFDGNSFVGSFYYSYQNEEYEKREYIEVQLIEPLVNNHAYRISWWTSLAGNSKYRVNSLGAALTISPLDDQFELYAFDVIPQVEITDFFGSASEWQQVIDTISAEGGEQYLTIGCFKHDDELGLEQISTDQTLGERSYYVIDMVEVVAIPVNVNEKEVNPPIISFDGSQITIAQTSNEFYNLKLFDVTGKLMLSLFMKDGTIDCVQYANGLYFLQYARDEETFVTKILIDRK